MSNNFCHNKILSQQRNEYYFKKTHPHLFNNQSIELSSSSETGNIKQEGEVMFKNHPTVGLPEASRLIDSAINKRQGDQRKRLFLEKKKIIHKRENGFTINTQKYHIT